MATTGLNLKLLRTAARLRQYHIGNVMGVSASRIAAIERESVVTVETERRYLAALAMCRTSSTPAEAAS